MVVGEALAGIKSRRNNETGLEEPCDLKDLCKTFATYYDEHFPDSLIDPIIQGLKSFPNSMT